MKQTNATDSFPYLSIPSMHVKSHSGQSTIWLIWQMLYLDKK